MNSNAKSTMRDLTPAELDAVGGGLIVGVRKDSVSLVKVVRTVVKVVDGVVDTVKRAVPFI